MFKSNAIICRDSVSLNRFARHMSKLGVRWLSGKPFTPNNSLWDHDIYYRLFLRYSGNGDVRIGYGALSRYSSHKEKEVSLDDVLAISEKESLISLMDEEL